MNIFEPGMVLLNHFRFARKFQLILVILTLPLIYSGVIIYNDSSAMIQAHDKQLVGMDVVSSLHPMRIVAAKHRGTAAQWLKGNQAAKATLETLEQEMSQVMDRAQASLKKHHLSTQTLELFKQLTRTWSDLQHNKLATKDPLDSFLKHNAWVRDASSLIDLVASETQLLLDSHMDTYMLMQMVVKDVPSVQEYLGQLRGRGAGVTTAGGFDPQSYVAVNTLYGNIAQIWQTVVDRMASIKRDNKAIANGLITEFEAASAAVEKFKHTTQTQLIQPDKPLISGANYFAAGTDAIQKVAQLLERSLSLYNLQITENKQAIQTHLTFVFIIFLTLVLLGMYLFTALKRSLDNNVLLTQGMATCLEQGDLSSEFKSRSKDELGFTVNSLSRAFTYIRDVVKQVRSHSSGLTETSSELQTVSNDVNQLGQGQKQRVGVIVTAATELAATAKEVAAHCENAADETQGAKDKASDGATRSKASANIIRELAQSIRLAGEEISDLAQQAASISTVIVVIKAIAEQTNLLALNAAIEAARAGEQGRGFAVVADEVRTLANRTQESTNEIETTIAKLQSVAEQAVTAMGSACEQADLGEAEAIQTGEALADIERSVNLVSNLIQQVASAGDQQAQAAEEIAQNIQNVDEASSELVEKAKYVAKVAGKVGSGSQQLDNTVKKFKV